MSATCPAHLILLALITLTRYVCNTNEKCQRWVKHESRQIKSTERGCLPVFRFSWDWIIQFYSKCKPISFFL
jgi:hypothetical protein